jgi:hypothetical protein
MFILIGFLLVVILVIEIIFVFFQFSKKKMNFSFKIIDIFSNIFLLMVFLVIELFTIICIFHYFFSNL